MIARIIDFSARNPFLIVVLVAAILAAEVGPSSTRRWTPSPTCPTSR